MLHLQNLCLEKCIGDAMKQNYIVSFDANVEQTTSLALATG